MELTLRFAHMWWAGFKVFCRWCVFWIVLTLLLTVLWLPFTELTSVIGDYAARTLGGISLVLIVPLIFNLTSQYLLLLGSDIQGVTKGREGPLDAAEQKKLALRGKIVTSTGVAFLSGFFVSPPDLVSALANDAVIAFLCAVPLLILARFPFLQSASNRRQTLICAIICLAAILAFVCLLLISRSYSPQH
jgi:hypothetical protein